MASTLSTTLRRAALALALLLGLTAANAAAQVETEPAGVDDVEDVDVQTDVLDDEEDEGFDDWGLLGLAGLAGLAGLLRRPQPPVVVDPPVTRTTVDRTIDTDTTRR